MHVNPLLVPDANRLPKGDSDYSILGSRDEMIDEDGAGLRKNDDMVRGAEGVRAIVCMSSSSICTARSYLPRG
jgi:hypothetical protein